MPIKPAFQMYASDFYADTAMLTQDEVGALVRIMCQYWRGSDVSTREQMEEAALGPVSERLDRHIKRELERLDTLRSEYAEISAMRSKSGRKGGKANAKQVLSKTEAKIVRVRDKVEVIVRDNDQSTKVELWPTFDDWWNAYAKKIDRPKCEAKWAKMTQAEREQAYRHTEAYVRATPDIQYRRHPQTYLNNANWNDEQLAQPKTATHGGQLSRSEFYARLEQVAGALGSNSDAADPGGS